MATSVDRVEKKPPPPKQEPREPVAEKEVGGTVNVKV